MDHCEQLIIASPHCIDEIESLALLDCMNEQVRERWEDI